MTKVVLKVEIGDGSTWADATSYVYSASWQCTRSDEMQKITTGSASIAMNNNGRLFDPLNVSSSFYPYLKPRNRMRIWANGIPQFYGWIDDISISYEKPDISVTTFTLIDRMGIIQSLVPSSDFTVGDTTTNGFMQAVSFWEGLAIQSDPLATTAVSGGTWLAADDASGEPGDELFPVLEKVVESEQGFFYADGYGYFIFLSRNVASAINTGLIFTDQASESNGVMNYEGINIVYGSERLYNTVYVQNIDLLDSVRKDATSVSQYGNLRFESTGLLTLDQGTLDDMADYLVAINSQPRLRIESIVVLAENLSSTNQTNLFNTLIGDTVTVKFFPAQYGQPINQLCRVVGISQDFAVDQTRVTLQLDTVEYVPFILDSADYGVLDQNRLGF